MVTRMIYLEENRAPTVLLCYGKRFLSKENVLRRYFYGAANDFSRRKMCSNGILMVLQMIFSKQIVLRRYFFGAVNYCCKENGIRWYFYGAANKFSHRKSCSDGTFMVTRMIFIEENRTPTLLLWCRKRFLSKENVLRR